MKVKGIRLEIMRVGCQLMRGILIGMGHINKSLKDRVYKPDHTRGIT